MLIYCRKTVEFVAWSQCLCLFCVACSLGVSQNNERNIDFVTLFSLFCACCSICLSMFRFKFNWSAKGRCIISWISVWISFLVKFHIKPLWPMFFFFTWHLLFYFIFSHMTPFTLILNLLPTPIWVLASSTYLELTTFWGAGVKK